MHFQIAVFGLSDIGLVRSNNEDVWAALADCHFYVLADGMGGHQAGEVAAREAVEILCEKINNIYAIDKRALEAPIARLHIEQAIEEVNEIVYAHSHSDFALQGMGTTLCCLQLCGQNIVYAHVGDSRIYRLRYGNLVQLTRDHSLLCEWLDKGRLTADEAAEFAHKHILTRAIGTDPHVSPTIHTEVVQLRDRYLLCSDGLSDLLLPSEIESILNLPSPPYILAETLIKAAKGKGGYDNITVIVIDIQEKESV